MTRPSDSQEFVYNLNGQRASIWDPQAGWEDQGQNYWGATPVEFYQDGYAQFQHQDYLGTERMRTSYTGAVDGTFTSLPFGDGYSASGNDHDVYHFAELDHDPSSDTDHALFRQYENTQGRWMSPDPYSGSYDINNPQSMNRYSYVLNNPLTLIDPSGLDEQADDSSNDNGCGIACQTYAAMGAGYGAGGGWGSWAGPVTPWDYAFGFAPGYTLDGQEISNRMAGWLSQSGAAQYWVANSSNYRSTAMLYFTSFLFAEVLSNGTWVDFTPADLFDTNLPQGDVMPHGGMIGGSPNSGKEPNNNPPKHFWQKPGCGGAIGETVVGGIGVGATIGVLVYAPELAPDVYEGAEGLMTLLHVAPVAAPGSILVINGAEGIWDSCFH